MEKSKNCNSKGVGMSIIQRRYRLLNDYNKVTQFLMDVYNTETYNSYLLRPFFEHAHHSYKFNHKLTHRFGLWEDGDKLVGITCYEMNLGECFLSVKNDYNELLPEMVKYAEENLSEKNNYRNKLKIWVNSKENDKKKLLENMDYKVTKTDPFTTFSYNKNFPQRILPEGFTFINLENENDLKKIDDCLWYGFDKGPDPYQGNDAIDRRLQMQSDKNFRKDLTTIIKAPDGKYVCYAGMRIEDQNEYAYLEPLATIPEYRHMGLATIALIEGMKKTKKLGMKYCFGGTHKFYYDIGFETAGYIEFWTKEW